MNFEPYIQTLEDMYEGVVGELAISLKTCLEQKGSVLEHFEKLQAQAENIQVCHRAMEDFKKGLDQAKFHLRHLDMRLKSSSMK